MSTKILTPNLEITGPTWLCGDIHGNQGEFFHQVAEHDIRDSSIILLGDVGVGFNHATPANFFRFFQRQLEARNNKAYLIRGNHDNPSFWSEEVVSDIEEKYPNVRMLHDGFISVNGELFYIVSGGVSVDRAERTENSSWWREERIKYQTPETIVDAWAELYDKDYDTAYLNGDNDGKEYRPVKGILSHTGYRPEGLDDRMLRSWCRGDKRLIDDVTEEAAIFENIFEGALGINSRVKKINGRKSSLWSFYGHFHTSWEKRSTKVSKKCLGIQELHQIFS